MNMKMPQNVVTLFWCKIENAAKIRIAADFKMPQKVL